MLQCSRQFAEKTASPNLVVAVALSSEFGKENSDGDNGPATCAERIRMKQLVFVHVCSHLFSVSTFSRALNIIYVSVAIFLTVTMDG